MLVKQCLVGVDGYLFAISVFLAMAAPTVLFAVLVSFFVLGLAPAVVFKYIPPFSFFTLKTRLSDTPKHCYRCPQQLKPCGGAPPPVGLWPLPSPLPLMQEAFHTLLYRQRPRAPSDHLGSGKRPKKVHSIE
jgi:hypothetical protein